MSTLKKANRITIINETQKLTTDDSKDSTSVYIEMPEVSINNNHTFSNDDDPLLRQLPLELVQYVRQPSDSKRSIVFVDRGKCGSMFHMCGVCLCSFLCCYSCCRSTIVKEDEILLTQNMGKPEMLGPGVHVILSPLNKQLGVRNVTESIIQNGPIHIIQVEIGKLGYGVDMETGQPILLSRGKHFINSKTFVWKRFINLKETNTVLDEIQIIRVETGNVAYCFRQGKLVILPPGLHLIEPPDRFGEIVSTQMSILDLPLAVHETSDYVPLAIKSAVFYRISDPYKALVRIQNVQQQILDTSVATLAGIIRSSSLSDVASRSQPFYHKAQNKNMKINNNESKLDLDDIDDIDDNNDNQYNINIIGENDKNIPGQTRHAPFFQHVHDKFLQQLHDHVLDEWGVEIQNIRIESLKIDDKKLQKDISAQAIDVSKQHNQYIMLQKKQEIVTVEAETRAQRIKIDTMAETNQTRQIAQADADALLIKAKAEKKANELIESTQLGKELAKMRIQANALSGLKQVAYIPHLNGLLSSQQGVFQTQGNLDLLPKININNS